MNALTVEIKGLAKKDIKVSVRKALSISEDIEYELRRAASMYGYYAVLAEEAQARLEGAEAKYDIWYSKESKALEEERGKFKTVEELKRHVKMIPKYASWMTTLAKYRKEYRMLKAISKAFEHKKDLVQSISANRRAENHGG